jgi:hypothetical protein
MEKDEAEHCRFDELRILDGLRKQGARKFPLPPPLANSMRGSGLITNETTTVDVAIALRLAGELEKHRDVPSTKFEHMT